MIVAAAIRIGPITLSMPAPARHPELIREARALGLPPATVGRGVQGFLSDTGAFLDRAAASLHVQRVGQKVLCLTFHPRGLFSEDLW
jgi:hypothetical protein